MKRTLWIALSYTNVFRWLGGESITTRMTTPLLGLTATAYRGHNEEETKRLVGRYSHNKLDDGVFGDDEPYHYLQQRGVLARVQQRVLSGMDIAWTPELERHLGQFAALPRDVENSVGQNFERNQAILDSITSQPDDWTTLLFAKPVEHARALAVELSYYEAPLTDLGRHGSCPPAAIHRAVPGRRDPRTHELRRSHAGIPRAQGSSRVRDAADVQPQPLPADDRTRVAWPAQRARQRF